MSGEQISDGGFKHLLSSNTWVKQSAAPPYPDPPRRRGEPRRAFDIVLDLKSRARSSNNRLLATAAATRGRVQQGRAAGETIL